MRMMTNADPAVVQNAQLEGSEDNSKCSKHVCMYCVARCPILRHGVCGDTIYHLLNEDAKVAKPGRPYNYVFTWIVG